MHGRVSTSRAWSCAFLSNGVVQMSSRFLRQSIATLLSLGALFGAADIEAGAIPTVDVSCPNFSCVPRDPGGAGWGGGGGGGWGGGGDWDTSGGGGGGGGEPEPECPGPPGGNSLLPSVKSLNCPETSCAALELTRPTVGCDSRVSRPSGWSEGRDQVRGGSPIARLMALADPGAPSGSRLSSAARERIQAGLASFNGAGGFADLSQIRRALSDSIGEACSIQRGAAPPGFNEAWTICADVAVDIHRESIDDPGFLAYTLGRLQQEGFTVESPRLGIISWFGGGNSLSGHFSNLQAMSRCASWWEQRDQLGCGR